MVTKVKAKSRKIRMTFPPKTKVQSVYAQRRNDPVSQGRKVLASTAVALQKHLAHRRITPESRSRPNMEPLAEITGTFDRWLPQYDDCNVELQVRDTI